MTTAQDKETLTTTESREIRTKQENLLVDHFSLETWGLILAYKKLGMVVQTWNPSILKR